MNELIDRYIADRCEPDFYKHGRATSSLGRTRKALAYFAELKIPAKRLGERKPTDEASGARVLGDVETDDLAKADLKDYIAHLCTLDGARAGEPIALSTVGTYRGQVLTMLEWAEDEEECIDAGPHARLSKAKLPKPSNTRARRARKVTSAPEEVIRRLADFCRGLANDHPDRTKAHRKSIRSWWLTGVALDLMWDLGTRPGELVQMRLCDLRADPSDADPDRHLYVPPESKTEDHTRHEDPRILVVDGHAMRLVAEAVKVNNLDGRQERFGFAQDFPDDERVFPWKAKNPVHAAAGFRGRVREAIERCGTLRITPQQIRHAWATRAAAINLEGARVQLGHTNPNTITGYLDRNGPAVREVIERLRKQDTPAPEPPAPTTPQPEPGGPAPIPIEEPPAPLRLVGFG
ncbi:MAG: tyrosine-type recombinase/integrase [Planctomycetota bacterium]